MNSACPMTAHLMAGHAITGLQDRQVFGQRERLLSTLLMFGTAVGPGKPVRLIPGWEPGLPEILCYPGDLNQAGPT